MNNEQQTAVDILCGKLAMKLGIPQAITFYIDHQEEIREAKEMEKEQKKECWDVAHQAGRFEGKGIAEKNWQTFEQYYEEIYGNNHIGDFNKMVGGEQ
jgi:hypothetical protein